MRVIPWVSAIAFAVPALWAARDYGLAFDSHRWLPYGDAILRYLTAHGPWPLNAFTEDFEAYGSLAALGAALTSALLHGRLGLVNALLGHHVFVVLCGATLVGLTAWLAGQVAGPRMALLAAALLAASPRFFAESENNMSDLPAAVAWTAALTLMLRAVRLERPGPLAGAAVAAAAVAAIRLPSFVFLPAVPILWLVIDGEARARAVRLWVAMGAGRIAALVLLFLVALWALRPLAWSAPRFALANAAHRFLAPPLGILKARCLVLHAGRMHFGGPPSYQVVMLGVTTPVPVLAAGLAGAWALWRSRRSAALFVAAWLAIAVGQYAILGRGNYDGVRHVLAAFPALALVGACGADVVLARLARARASAVAAAVWTIGVLVLVAPGALAIWRLHPYPVTYFNALIGGLPRAARSFETEYSGAVYREALEWAAHHLTERDTLWIAKGAYDRRLVEVEADYLGLHGPVLVSGTVEDVAAREHAGGRLFAVQRLRWAGDDRLAPDVRMPPLPVVYEVRREGVPLLRIHEVPVEELRRVLHPPA